MKQMHTMRWENENRMEPDYPRNPSAPDPK